MQNQEPLPTSSDGKEELELAKLRLEIADLQKPFWKRPSYVLAALPTMLATLTLAYGFASGYFSASFTKLENQKHDLEAQIKDFDARKSVLQNQNAELEAKLTKLQTQITATKEASHLATQSLNTFIDYRNQLPGDKRGQLSNDDIERLNVAIDKLSGVLRTLSAIEIQP